MREFVFPTTFAPAKGRNPFTFAAHGQALFYLIRPAMKSQGVNQIQQPGVSASNIGYIKPKERSQGKGGDLRSKYDLTLTVVRRQYNGRELFGKCFQDPLAGTAGGCGGSHCGNARTLAVRHSRGGSGRHRPHSGAGDLQLRIARRTVHRLLTPSAPGGNSGGYGPKDHGDRRGEIILQSETGRKQEFGFCLRPVFIFRPPGGHLRR